MMNIRAFILSALTVFAVGTAMAQPRGAEPVVPGSKGNLPALNSSIPQAEEGRFGALGITEINTTISLFSGDVYSRPYAELSYLDPKQFGGEYYTLEHRESKIGTWETVENYENIMVADDTWYDGVHHAYTISVYFDKEWGDTDYRLVLHGGDKDGWISNEITAIYPRVFGSKMGSTYSNVQENLYVGMTISTLEHGMIVYYDPYDWNVSNSYDFDCPYYSFSWYRRNPNTYEMTLIQGATSQEYTTTAEDIGYEIVGVTRGDDEHVAAYTELSHGLCQVAIQGCPGYVANDCFVLNTDYILPNGGKDIGQILDYDAPAEPLADGVIEEIKPGQYLFHVGLEEMRGLCLGYTVPGYQLTFLYDFGYEDEETGQYITRYVYREAQIIPDRYLRTLQIKPLLNEEAVATTIDILGKNAYGKFGIVATLTPEEAENGVFSTELYQGKYYVKAHQTEETMETYYPDALVWSDASLIEPESESWEEDWQPTCATINMVAAPAPLTGTCVIEGTITVVGKARTRSGEASTYTVYLKDKATGKIVAQTQTDANGNYKFENVPIGEYIIVPNVDGYKAASPVAVAVTQENQTVSNADCKVTKVSTSEIFNEEGSEEETLAGDADGNGTVDVNDITLIVKYLLGESVTINMANADYNQDGNVDVADIIAIVNKL